MRYLFHTTLSDTPKEIVWLLEIFGLSHFLPAHQYLVSVGHQSNLALSRQGGWITFRLFSHLAIRLLKIRSFGLLPGPSVFGFCRASKQFGSIPLGRLHHVPPFLIYTDSSLRFYFIFDFLNIWLRANIGLSDSIFGSLLFGLKVIGSILLGVAAYSVFRTCFHPAQQNSSFGLTSWFSNIRSLLRGLNHFPPYLLDADKIDIDKQQQVVEGIK